MSTSQRAAVRRAGHSWQRGEAKSAGKSHFHISAHLPLQGGVTGLELPVETSSSLLRSPRSWPVSGMERGRAAPSVRAQQGPGMPRWGREEEGLASDRREERRRGHTSLTFSNCSWTPAQDCGAARNVFFLAAVELLNFSWWRPLTF